MVSNFVWILTLHIIEQVQRDPLELWRNSDHTKGRPYVPGANVFSPICNFGGFVGSPIKMTLADIITIQNMRASEKTL